MNFYKVLSLIVAAAVVFATVSMGLQALGVTQVRHAVVYEEKGK